MNTTKELQLSQNVLLLRKRISEMEEEIKFQESKNRFLFSQLQICDDFLQNYQKNRDYCLCG